ncbi:hypothetical protein RF11_14144 [Thelohanellus kitauei]|uniref:Uncharacterized protein n=1 Tax=Thelohanellus kitauei TaxID=669202 RepID=A0A0C2IYT2_THEKT|nr:hypothetical protein RF11_14144 [Thelohanellus kitauei]
MLNNNDSETIKEAIEHYMVSTSSQDLVVQMNGVKNIKSHILYQFFSKRFPTNRCNKFRMLSQVGPDSKGYHNSGLCRVQLSENENQIKNKYSSTKDEDIAWLLFIICRVFHGLKLLDGVEFNISKFYINTDSIFLVEINKRDYLQVFPRMSQKWKGIVKGSENSINIDTIDKLILMASIFAIDLSKKMKHAVNGFGKFEIFKIIKHRFNVLYLTLVTFPIIDHSAKSWLRAILIELHDSVQKYIEKTLLNDMSFENRLFMTQYFIKSHVTLHIEISDCDNEKIHRFLTKLSEKKQRSIVY